MCDAIPYPDQDSALINELIGKIKKSGAQRDYIDLIRYTKMLSQF